MPSGDSLSKWTLRVAGTAGLALLLCFFALTFQVPQGVETFAKDYIEREVWQELDASIDDLGPADGSSAAERLAAAWYERNRQQVEDVKARLKDRSRDLFREALAQVRDLSDAGVHLPLSLLSGLAAHHHSR